MLTLATPLSRTVSGLSLTAIHIAPGALTLSIAADDGARVTNHELRVTASSRQGLRVTNGVLDVFDEAASGEMAAVLTAFASGAGNISARLVAVESRLRAQNLLPAGTVS